MFGDLVNTLISADLVKKLIIALKHKEVGLHCCPPTSPVPLPLHERTRVLFLLRVSSSVCKVSSSRAAVCWDFWASAHFASLSSNWEKLGEIIIKGAETTC